MTENEFTGAVTRNSQRLFLIALSFTHDRTDAEDVLQTVFLKLWQEKKPFENAEHIDKWLTRVTVNSCKNLLKTAVFKRHRPLEEAESLYTFDCPEDRELFLAVMQLPKKQSTVIHLFYYEDLSVKEIAATLRIKESSVKTRLCRGRMKLKELLGEEWRDE